MNLIEHIHEKKLINVFVKYLRQCLHEEENTKNIREFQFEGLMYTIWTSLCVVEAYTTTCLRNTS